MDNLSDLGNKASGVFIKSCPEDFVVIEKMPNSKLEEFRSTKNGKFSIFSLKKRGVDIISAIRTLSRIYNIRERGFSYAGTKDKNAITFQYCSAFGKIFDKNTSFGNSGDFIEVKRVGHSQRPISLGDHVGNEFIIRVRNVSEKSKRSLPISVSQKEGKTLDKKRRALKGENMFLIPNYFGSQRFGLLCNNHVIGKLIILSRFDEAVDLIKEQMKEKISQNLLGLLGIEFLKALNPKHAMMYVHSYQSYIFNRAISSYVKENYDSFTLGYEFGELAFPKKEEIKRLAKKRYQKVSLAGFGFEREGIINKYVLKEMEEEGVKDRDFIVRQIPSLSAESHERDFLIRLKQFSIKEKGSRNQEDEYLKYKSNGFGSIDGNTKPLENNSLKVINETQDVYEVKFTLGKGSYATIVIAGLFNQKPVVP